MILFSISVIGIIGIQIGNPKNLTNAIALESTFVVLIALSFWRLRYVLIPNMIITIIAIIVNTASPKHLEIMSSFKPLENASVNCGRLCPTRVTFSYNSEYFQKQKESQDLILFCFSNREIPNKMKKCKSQQDSKNKEGLDFNHQGFTCRTYRK